MVLVDARFCLYGHDVCYGSRTLGYSYPIVSHLNTQQCLFHQGSFRNNSGLETMNSASRCAAVGGWMGAVA